MTFDWNSLIPLAIFLENKCIDLKDAECIDKEAIYRTIINRSYYAAYNVSKKFALKQFTEITRSGGAHRSLIKTFQLFRAENTEYSVIASNLDRILKRREQADYEATFRLSTLDNAARYSLTLSQRIIEIIGNIENQPVS